MRARMLAVVGMSSAALMTAAYAPIATGTARSDMTSRGVVVAPRASTYGNVAASPVSIDGKRGKCGTKFGPELPTPDGIISWNDTSGTGFDTAGAADFTCKKPVEIRKVQVYGYFGAPLETFNVTIYTDDPAGTLHEPDDAGPGDADKTCFYTDVPGEAGGQYPTPVLTTLKLPIKCILGAAGKAGPTTYWLSVQNNDAAGPWYWEMQDSSGGLFGPDWVDRHDAFGSGCTTFSNDRYLVDCLGYTYPDFMFKLK